MLRSLEEASPVVSRFIIIKDHIHSIFLPCHLQHVNSLTSGKLYYQDGYYQAMFHMQIQKLFLFGHHVLRAKKHLQVFLLFSLPTYFY